MVLRFSRWALLAMLLPVVSLSTACAQPPASAQTFPDSLGNLGALVQELSVDGGYFDTDNLISNELGYQQVLGAMQRLGVHGGAYIGVGPDQNFTYIAAVRPRIAFVVDIRRDNMLQHMLFKALFAASRNRAEYMSLWTGRPVPPDVSMRGETDIAELVRGLDSTHSTDSSTRYATDVVQAWLRNDAPALGVVLSEADLGTIARFHQAFIADGLSLRFHSEGRAPQPHHPTLRQLLLEHDADGTMRSYLATESAFQYVKSMQQRNLIVPVTGDLAGSTTLPGIGRWLEARGERVSVLYASNVEDYLIRDRRFAGFVHAVRDLPRTPEAVLIRSFFGGGYGHPEAEPAYYATQLLQRMDSFANDSTIANVRRYRELVIRDWVPLRVP